jgi:hypothetical protein
MFHLLLQWCTANTANLLATASLSAISAGCAMYSAPLGLIVPGVIVFSLLVYSRLRGDG